MPRFVILRHDHPFLHWDFMLENAGALRTWRLLDSPADGALISAQPLPDHRLQYLDYEGPVGGNRGTVSRWDAGNYQVLQETASRLEIRLAGEKLNGDVVLESLGPEAGWSFHLVSS